jgi:hypothetical protein
MKRSFLRWHQGKLVIVLASMALWFLGWQLFGPLPPQNCFEGSLAHKAGHSLGGLYLFLFPWQESSVCNFGIGYLGHAAFGFSFFVIFPFFVSYFGYTLIETLYFRSVLHKPPLPLSENPYRWNGRVLIQGKGEFTITFFFSLVILGLVSAVVRSITQLL